MRKKLIAWSMEWEGCFTISKAKRSRGNAFQYVPVVMLDNTRPILVEAFCQLVGYGKTYVHRRYKEINRKDLFKWQLVNLKDVLRFCEEVLPYLITKRRQAEILLGFCRRRLLVSRKGISMSKGQITFTDEDDGDWREMKLLNKRGILREY